MLDTTKKSSRYQGKHESFKAPTSGLEDVVFNPSSSAADFKKFNDCLAHHVGVTFKLFGPPMSKALRKLVKPLFVLLAKPDPDSKSYQVDVIVWTETWTEVKDDRRQFTEANQKLFNLIKQHCAPAIMQKVHTHADWNYVED